MIGIENPKRFTKEMKEMRTLIEAIIATSGHYCSEIDTDLTNPPELAERVGERDLEECIKILEGINVRLGEINQLARPLLNMLKYGIQLNPPKEEKE